MGVDSSDRGRPRFGSWLWHASGGRPEHTKRRTRSPERSIGTRPFDATGYDPCMSLPTEPIGSIPRPQNLQDAMKAAATGTLAATALEALYDDAVRDTLRRFEETGSPVVTDGEQRKPSFATYPVAGLPGLQPGGVVIPFDDGHTRQLPVITQTPFRYATKASIYLDKARGETSLPMKQAVISASAVSLMYPQAGIPGYDRDAFLEDVVSEASDEMRGCLERGATVQIDFTEARLSLKLDPSGGLLNAFVDLNNRVLATLTNEQRANVGVHTCPGGDQDSTHSADIDYAALLPALFELNVDRFFVQLASEADREHVLAILGGLATGSRRIFVGVTDPIDPRVESAEEVRLRILEAARFIDPEHLGTTDDCGFSPFGDDTSTSRDIAFAKIRARVEGTQLASRDLGA
jgi:5-methyltetrahydropteroyltriglutamate--homocysteine methyltransferase